MSAPQNPTSEQNQSQQKGLPASNWSRSHTFGLVLFVVVVVMATIPQWMSPRGTWIVLATALLAFAALAGHGIKGVWRGVFIDDRNMISLSRLQILVWATVVISAYATLALARVQEAPLSALDVKVPDTLWLLMGISTTSLVGSPLMKSTKTGKGLALAEPQEQQTLEHQRQGLSDEVRTEGRIVCKRSVNDARWSDLFTGEEVTNVAHLDVAKIQMFFFTIVLVLSYVVALWSLFTGECASADAVAPAPSGETPGPETPACAVPEALPGLSDGAVTLIGISHGGYLLNKAVPASG